jgi:hypothetical protein
MIKDFTKTKSDITYKDSRFCRKFEVTTNQITMANVCNSTQEKWKDIPSFEGFYQVSNLGRVRSLDRVIFDKKKNRHLSLKGVILKDRKSPKTRYLQVSLTDKTGKAFYPKIHRLVAEAFIPNPHNKSEVNHIDLNRFNNSATNLEWCTRKENMVHAAKGGVMKGNYITLKKYYEKNEMRKALIVVINEQEYFFNSTHEVITKFGIGCSSIYNRLNGKYKHPINGMMFKRPNQS